MDIEGASFAELRDLPNEDLDALLAFGRPITFKMGSAEILAEFNRLGSVLQVNLAHIDDGGEGVLVRLWKLIVTYARRENFDAIEWDVHALTCADPNPRLLEFLDKKGFSERDDGQHGRVLHLLQKL